MKTVLSGLAFAALVSGLACPAAAEPRGEAAGDARVVAERHGAREGARREARREGEDTVLPRGRIERIMRRGGFVEVEDIRLRRDSYVVTAIRPNGAVFRLAVDASDGDIIARERIGWTPGYDRRDFDRHREPGSRSPGPGSRGRFGG